MPKQADALYALGAAIAPGEIFLRLLKGKQALLRIKLQRAVAPSVSRTSSPMVTYSACAIVSMLRCLDMRPPSLCQLCAVASTVTIAIIFPT